MDKSGKLIDLEINQQSLTPAELSFIIDEYFFESTIDRQVLSIFIIHSL